MIDYVIGKDYKTDTGLKVTCVFVGTEYATLVTETGQAVSAALKSDSVLQPLATDAESIVAEFKPGTTHEGYVPVSNDIGWGKTVFNTFEEAKQSNGGAVFIAHLYFDQDTKKAFVELLDPNGGGSDGGDGK